VHGSPSGVATSLVGSPQVLELKSVGRTPLARASPWTHAHATEPVCSAPARRPLLGACPPGTPRMHCRLLLHYMLESRPLTRAAPGPARKDAAIRNFGKGGMKGFWAVTVRANWRVIFRFADPDAFDVDYMDYH